MPAGRTPGAVNKRTAEARDICRELLERPAVRKRYREQLDAGSLAPTIEAMLWHYAYGVPKQVVEHQGSSENPLEVILSWQPLPHHDPPALE